MNDIYLLESLVNGGCGLMHIVVYLFQGQAQKPGLLIRFIKNRELHSNSERGDGI